MSRAIEPIRGVAPIPPRRQSDGTRPERAGQGDAVDLRASVAAKPTAGAPRGRSDPSTTLEAHLAAQGAQLRGLKGGQERLETARHVYLGTEFSGPNDRRPPKGLITRRDV
jgi:hypothetical protein